MKSVYKLLILLKLLPTLAIAQVESRYAYAPGLLLRETFESEAYTTVLNGTQTEVTYQYGTGVFNGTTSKITYLPEVGIMSVRITIRSLASSTQNILKLSSSHSITVSSGTISATGFTSPSIYVNGAATSTITTAGGEVVITTATALTANDIQLGYVSSYLSGTVDLFELYNFTLTAGQVNNLYNAIPIFSGPSIGGEYAYGVQWDATSSSPDGTRVGVMAYHASLPVQSNMRACLLNDNGTVNYYLLATDWTKKTDGSASKLDGTDGQVMIEVPEHYYTNEKVGNYEVTYISSVNLPGFTRVPKFYYGAYKAALNRSTFKLSSIVNTSTTYRGGNNTSAWDAGANTLLGKPATSLTRANYRTYAANRGAGWSQQLQWQRDAIFRLFMVEYATRNSQKAVNTSLDGSGYKQGGLGSGVTTITSADWNTFNSYNPLVPCGQGNTLGNGSGEVSYAIASFPGSSGTVKVNRYRGIEDPFGDIWEFVDGVNIYVDASFNGQIYTKAAGILTDDTSTGYQRTGTLPAADGYIKTMNLQTLLPAVSAGSSSSTYYCDYFYKSGSSSVWRVVLVGGTASDGASAGFGYVYSNGSSSKADTYIGSRLCFFNGL